MIPKDICRLAVAAGVQKIPETLDVPLATGEVRLLTVRTEPLSGAAWHDMRKVTTKLVVEWMPAGTGDRP